MDGSSLITALTGFIAIATIFVIVAAIVLA
jgi:hypothetical protein